MNELDALIASKLFRHDIVVDNAILTAEPEPLTFAKLKAAIESLRSCLKSDGEAVLTRYRTLGGPPEQKITVYAPHVISVEDE